MNPEYECYLDRMAYFWYDAWWASKIGVPAGSIRMRRIE